MTRDPFYRSLKDIFRLDKIPAGRISYSQCGEDLLVDYVFRLRGVEKPTYIDVGAFDPFHLNNTAIFYHRGARGVNIDANPDRAPQFIRHRPLDLNLNMGAGCRPGIMQFFVMRDPTLSTFSEEEREHLRSVGHEWEKTISVRVETLASIIDRYNGGRFPDFLSLDAEGLDLDVLRSIDYGRSAPKVICVEAAEYSPTGKGKRRADLVEFLDSRGYFEYASTNLNAIMVSKDFWA